ncbi:hypothetical protein WA026_005840 [Henosepilachna vigintioctopunctata]|uniref:Cytochrome P450 n=1 Tax=Henosepilachna vigintioctopunctata TaxID=420089 RepID=A0AAW1U2Z8_9CUCU
MEKLMWQQKGIFYDGLRRITGEGLGANNTEYWKDRRKLLTKCFHFNVVNNLIDTFNEQTHHMVNRLKENLDKCVDIESYLQNMTLRIITETNFGKLSKITEEDTSKYISGMKTITEIIILRALKPHLSLFWPILKIKKDEDKALRDMYCYTSKAIGENMERIIEEDENFPNILQLLRSSPELFDNQEIRNELETFFFAGHGTASRSLTFTIIALANYPHYQEKVYQEIKSVIGEKRPTYSDLTKMEFLDRFIKESLRLFPPAILIERTLTKDLITATGFRLPADTIVLFSIFDIHRNPNLYPDPEVFDPDRFLPENVEKRHKFAYIPFSAGPRNCIAKKYAIWEKKATICGLLQNFKLEAVTKIENMEFSLDLMLKNRDGFEKLTILRCIGHIFYCCRFFSLQDLKGYNNGCTAMKCVYQCHGISQKELLLSVEFKNTSGNIELPYNSLTIVDSYFRHIEEFPTVENNCKYEKPTYRNLIIRNSGIMKIEPEVLRTWAY